MTTLVLGGSGATRKLLVAQLLQSGQKVKMIVRPISNIPDCWHREHALTIIKEDITKISVADMVSYLSDCQAVASCLGHNLNWKGMFGQPKELVTTAVSLISKALAKKASPNPVKLILMNTAGNSNRDLDEVVSLGEKMVITLIRTLLPPHKDNEKAADYLRQKNPYMEWIAVRPDSLIDLEVVTAYTVHSSPIRSAIFNPGKTSRINVAHFMSKLLTDEATWTKWKGQMPVIYNDV